MPHGEYSAEASWLHFLGGRLHTGFLGTLTTRAHIRMTALFSTAPTQASLAAPTSWRVWSGRLLVALLCLSSHALGNASEFCRPQDSLWEISSRALPNCPPPTTEHPLEILQLQHGCWSAQTLEPLQQLVAAADGQRLVIYVHGNWMSREDARQRAWKVYQKLVCRVDCEPICFVAFSWPSERSEGFARDVIGKKLRLDADAYYLACFVKSLELQKPIGYLGYSFGGAVICGARHLLAGGSLHCVQLADLPAVRYQDRISLIAPAFDRQGLTDSGEYSQALVDVDKLVNVYNSIDPILRRFRFFDRDKSPTAAGFAGILEPRSLTPLSADQKIVQFDCRCIGRTHAELDYLNCPWVVLALQNVVGR